MTEKKPELPTILVTSREGAPEDESVLKTPAGEANLKVVSMPWWHQALVRAGRTWAQGVGANIVTAGTAIAAVKAMGIDFPASWPAIAVTVAAILVEPLRAASASLIWNGLELTAQWDTSKTAKKFRA